MFVQEILDVWRKIPTEKRRHLILDNYKLKDGIYILVHKDLSFDTYLVDNKKEIDNNVRQIFAEYDYNSNYVNNNKSIDKRVFSASPFAFFTRICTSKDEFVKDKLGTLNPLFFNEKYFEVLENGYHMNLDRNFIYFLENYIDDVFDRIIDLGFIKNKDLDKNKTILKFFYETDVELYEEEYRKYEKDKIFNTNEANIEINGVIFGTSNFSNSYNKDKKFICPKTMPSSIPFRISIDDAFMLKDFAQWINNQSNNFIRIGYDDDFRMRESYNFGYIVQTMKDKMGLHIVSFDNYGIKEKDKKKYVNHNMNDLLKGKNIVQSETVEQVLNYHLFCNSLFRNYFSSIIEGMKVAGNFENNNIALILKENRNMLFNSFYRNKPMSIKFLEKDIPKIIDESMLALINNKKLYSDDVLLRLAHYERIRLNLLKTYQYKGDKLMEDNIELIQSELIKKLNTKENVPIIESDKEYYFLIGQILYYFASKSNRDTTRQVSEILKLNNTVKAKKYIDSIVKKNLYKMEHLSYRLRNAISCIYAYEPQKYDRDSLVIGLCLAHNMFYVKNEDIQEENENEE